MVQTHFISLSGGREGRREASSAQRETTLAEVAIHFLHESKRVPASPERRLISVGAGRHAAATAPGLVSGRIVRRRWVRRFRARCRSRSTGVAAGRTVRSRLGSERDDAARRTGPSNRIQVVIGEARGVAILEVEPDQCRYVGGVTPHDAAKLARGADKNAVVGRIEENCDSNRMGALGHGAFEEDVNAAGLTTIGDWMGTRCEWSPRG